MLDMLQMARFKGANVRRLIPLGDATPLHTYVHRRRAEVMPLLAAALRQMKNEGLIERYRLESLKEINGR